MLKKIETDSSSDFKSSSLACDETMDLTNAAQMAVVFFHGIAALWYMRGIADTESYVLYLYCVMGGENFSERLYSVFEKNFS